GTLEPRMDDLVGRLRKLQRAKQALSQELQDSQARSKELQEELEERCFHPPSWEEICSQKQELLRTLQLRSQETEAEGQRLGCSGLTQERKQHIEELAAKIQEEKLKQRKHRLEFEQLLGELMGEHQSLEKLAAEIHSMAESKEHLLSEDRLIQASLAQVEKQLDSLPQARAALSQERMFLKSQEASTALQLFQQENKSATEHLEAASLRHSELQQKYKRQLFQQENKSATEHLE
uniref:Uncharacterized protein n=1 Tax=Pelodiscus sinensis TaxID=13735 RepID=K7FPR7_PELSI